MQSILFAVLVVLLVCWLGEAVPVNTTQLNNDSETRLIVPPEMTSNYFELLKVKSENQANSTKAEKADFTPMNFLRTTDDAGLNTNSLGQKPLLAFEGSKQTPIFITIPIYITSSGQGLPIVSTSLEGILPPQTTSKVPHNISERSVKTEDINKLESPLSVDTSKKEYHVPSGKHFRIKGRYLKSNLIE